MQHERPVDHRHHYRNLVLMALLSFLAMFVLMYAMVDRFANVYANLNQVYMAGLMAAPMVLIELAVMSGMYRNVKWNVIVASLSVIVLLTCYILIRSQGGIGDKQFLRSMVPHHAAAILMCEEADLKDPEIKNLCARIRASQQSEIEEMKTKLKEMGR
jgi:hypothetical protein